MGRFSHIRAFPPDPIIDLSRQYKADSSSKKVDLGVGAYRNDVGEPYVLPVVKKADALVAAQKGYNHEYLPIEGYASFNEAAKRLLLGADHEAVTRGRIATVQSLSGTGCLRIGFELLRRHVPSSVVYLSNPTWGNHARVIHDSGISVVRTYRYYNAKDVSFDFEGMMEDLQQAPSGAIIVLHVCAHNPTGFDPSKEQWQEIATLCKEKDLFPFFDNAYQGYATGNLLEDVYSVRLFADLGIEFFCACSFAKNMGLYGERVGALHICCSTKEEAAIMESQIKGVIRPNYSSPCAHYAKVAALVMSDPALFAEWQEQLSGMSNRILRMRTLLVDALERHQCPGSWEHLLKQWGMFSLTGLKAEHVATLKSEYSIYMLSSGRASMSGLREDNVDYVAKAFKEVLSRNGHGGTMAENKHP